MHSHRRSHKRPAVSGKWILGVDPTKERHTAALLIPQGEMLGTAFSFAVTAHGFRETLPKQLTKRLPRQQPDQLLIAVATSCNRGAPSPLTATARATPCSWSAP